MLGRRRRIKFGLSVLPAMGIGVYDGGHGCRVKSDTHNQTLLHPSIEESLKWTLTLTFHWQLSREFDFKAFFRQRSSGQKERHEAPKAQRKDLSLGIILHRCVVCP